MSKKEDRRKEIDEIKKIIEEKIEDYDCGIYDTRNVVGDPMSTLYEGKYIQLGACYYFSYYEVFGTTKKEFKEIEEFYKERI